MEVRVVSIGETLTHTWEGTMENVTTACDRDFEEDG